MSGRHEIFQSAGFLPTIYHAMPGVYVKIRDGAARQLDVLVHLLVARALLDAGHPLPPSLRKFKVDLKLQEQAQ